MDRIENRVIEVITLLAKRKTVYLFANKLSPSFVFRASETIVYVCQ